MPTPTANTNSTEGDLEIEWLETRIHKVVSRARLSYEKVVDPFIVGEIVDRYNKEVRRYSASRPTIPGYGPNIFKRAGYLSFWVRKLKPLRCGDRAHQYANEALAYFLGLALIDSVHAGDIGPSRRVKKTSRTAREAEEAVGKFREELCYSMRYRPMSPYALGLIFFCVWQLQADVRQSN